MTVDNYNLLQVGDLSINITTLSLPGKEGGGGASMGVSIEPAVRVLVQRGAMTCQAFT